MPKPYLPLSLKHYTPVFKPMPVPDLQSACDEPLVCVRFSEKLVPYLLGILEIYRWPDALKGTEEEVQTALGVFQELMTILSLPCGCDDTGDLLRQLIASNNALYALQIEQSDDGTPQSFAPDAPENWSGNNGGSSTENDRRDAALCAAIDRLITQAVRGVADFLLAAGLIGSAVAGAVSIVNPVFGFILGTFATSGAALFTAIVEDTNAQRRVRCCMFANLRNAGEISFETFKLAASGCDFDLDINETFLADQVMTPNLSVEANYRAFVRMLDEEYQRTSDGDNGENCACCDETPRITLDFSWPSDLPAYSTSGATIERIGERRWRFIPGIQSSNNFHQLWVEAIGDCNFCVKEFYLSELSGYSQTQVWNNNGGFATAVPQTGDCLSGFNLSRPAGTFICELEICDGGCEASADCTGCD